MKEGIEASLSIFDNDTGDASSPPQADYGKVGILKKSISNEPSESVTEETSAMTSAANTSATDFTFEIDLPPPDDVSPLSCKESVVTAMLNRTLDRTLEQVLPSVPSLIDEEEDYYAHQQTSSPKKRSSDYHHNHHHNRRSHHHHHHHHHHNRHNDHRHDGHRRSSDRHIDYSPTKDDRRRRSRSSSGFRHSEDEYDQKRSSRHRSTSERPSSSRRSKSKDYGDSRGPSSHRTRSRSRDGLSSSDDKKGRHRSRSRAATEREGEKTRGLTISSIREEVEEDMTTESQKPFDGQSRRKSLTRIPSPIPPSSHRSPTKRSSISAPRSPSRRSERSHSRTGETTRTSRSPSPDSRRSPTKRNSISAPRSPSRRSERSHSRTGETTKAPRSPSRRSERSHSRTAAPRSPSRRSERSHSRTAETRSPSRSRHSSPSKSSSSRRSESKSRTGGRSSSCIPADRDRSTSKSRARSSSHKRSSSSTRESSSLLFSPTIKGESPVGILRPSFLSRLAEVNEKAEEEEEEEQEVDEVDQSDKEERPKSIRWGTSEETEIPTKSKNKNDTSLDVVAEESDGTSQRKLNTELSREEKKSRARSRSRAGRSHSKSRSRGESKARDNPEQKDKKPAGWNELLNVSMQLSTDSFKFDPADAENGAPQQADKTKVHQTAVGVKPETAPVTNDTMERLRKANALILEKKKRREDSKARQKQLDLIKSPSPVTIGLEKPVAPSGAKEEIKTSVAPPQAESEHGDVKMQKHPEFSASAYMESSDMLNLDTPVSPKVVEAGAQFLPALRESNHATSDDTTTGSPVKGSRSKTVSETKLTEETSKNTRNRRRENRRRDGRRGNKTATSNKWRELQTRVDALTKSDSKPQDSNAQNVPEMESSKADLLQTGSDEKTSSQEEPLEPVVEEKKPKSRKLFDSLRQSLHGQSAHGKPDSKIWGTKKEKKCDESDQKDETQPKDSLRQSLHGMPKSMKWGISSKKPVEEEGENLEEGNIQEAQSKSTSVGRSKWAGVKGSLLFISLMKSKAPENEPEATEN